jgi:hypothetical protein
MKIRRFLAAFVLAALLGSCDTAPQAAVTAPPVAPDKARLYFYRDANIYDALVWTAVSLNGQRVGDSAPGTVFYRDVAPGTYRIEARSDKLYPGQPRTVVVGPGTTTFIKVQVLPSWGQSGRQWQGNTFAVAIVDPAVGRYQIGNLRLTPG